MEINMIEKLTKLIVPASVETISDSAFRNCENLYILKFAGLSPTIISKFSLQNSAINCLQIPQGIAVTAIFLNSRSPSLTAFKRATRSAHTVFP